MATNLEGRVIVTSDKDHRGIREADTDQWQPAATQLPSVGDETVIQDTR